MFVSLATPLTPANFQRAKTQLLISSGCLFRHSLSHLPEANFARASGQLHAKPLGFCKHAAGNIIRIKNEDAIKKI